MAERNHKGIGRSMPGCIIRILAKAVFAYGLASVVVFDFASPALRYDVDYLSDGRRVAIGPRPRIAFCAPPIHGIDYRGDEAVFIVFEPICIIWCAAMGYARP